MEGVAGTDVAHVVTHERFVNLPEHRDNDQRIGHNIPIDLAIEFKNR